MAKTYNPMPKAAKIARAFIWVQAVSVLALAGVTALKQVNGQAELGNWLKFGIHVLGVPAGVAVPDSVPAFVREQHWRVAAAAAVAALLWILFAVWMRGQKRVLYVVILAAEIALIAANVAAIWVIDAPVYGAVLGSLLPLIVVWNLSLRVPRRWFHH